jgi:hypothetical protein
MTDDEVIDTFLKENEAELSRLSAGRKLRRGLITVGIALPLSLAGVKAIQWAEDYRDRRIAEQKTVDDKNALLEKIKQEKEVAKLAAKRHTENQYAYITVLYAADGHAAECWITQHKSDVIVLTENTPSAYSYISNYKDYVHYGTILRMDPKMCIVMKWEGQDP